MRNDLVNDYWRARRVARYWARVALDNKRDGMPWHMAAVNAHDALRWALFIVR